MRVVGRVLVTAAALSVAVGVTGGVAAANLLRATACTAVITASAIGPTTSQATWLMFARRSA